MKFILGKKLNMTELFGEAGVVQVATVLDVKPLIITQVKSATGADGYNAVQVGAGSRREKNIAKPQREALKDLGNFAVLKEFRLGQESAVTRGAKIDLNDFTVGDVVEVSATTKGKGFQGAVKRHGFSGGPRSHGQKHSEREVGSIGGGGRAGGRVAKGMRMAGRMGGNRVTIKNLKVVHIDPELNQLFISGAIPGRRGSWVEIRQMDK